MVAQHRCVGADSPLVRLRQVGNNELHSGGRLVVVGCNLVSLNLVVSSRNPNKDGRSRGDGVGEVLILKDPTRPLMNKELRLKHGGTDPGFTHLGDHVFEAEGTAPAGTGCGAMLQTETHI